MIAIFNTEQIAVVFSNKIHIFLKTNRAGYNAEKWSETNKSDNEEKWAVKIHPDIDTLAKKFNLDIPGNNEHQIIEFVDKLPENWYNMEA